MTAGRFVVLEGGEASGKSTQVPLLARRLRERGREVVETFEPGATPLGASIRALLLDGDDAVDARTETLLLAADRAQHLLEIVGPALASGVDVVSDRHSPSTLAYQGVGRGLGVAVVESLNRWATAGLEPDLVVVLDVEEEVAAARHGVDLDRLERAGVDFHAAVRQAYRDLAVERGWVLVDGGGAIEQVTERVWAIVQARLGS